MWAFREQVSAGSWIWIELGPDGRALQSSEGSFVSWYGAVVDATDHGFDHSRHPFQMLHFIDDTDTAQATLGREKIREEQND